MNQNAARATAATEAAPLNVLLLIAEVHNRRPIWDKRHDLHNQRDLVDALWSEVAVVIGVPVSRIRSKWKNLKDSFRREAKKALSEVNYRPKWHLYQPLMFLNDQLMEFDVKEEDSTYLEPDQTHSKYDCEFDPLSNENGSRINVTPCRPEFYEPEGYLHPRRSDLHADDPDMCFFRSLLPHMKELSPRRRMQLRIKIHEMVYKEIYSDKSDSGRQGNRK